GHPVLFVRCGDVFHQLAPIAAVQLDATFAGGADKGYGQARVIRHGHDRSLAIARVALQAESLGVHGFIGLKLIQSAAGAPGPSPQGAPIVQLAWLALVDQTDDALRQALAVVRLHAAGRQAGVAPTFRQNLLLPTGSGGWSRHGSGSSAAGAAETD